MVSLLIASLVSHISSWSVGVWVGAGIHAHVYWQKVTAEPALLPHFSLLEQKPDPDT